jgi:hypothetical protein
MIAFRSHASDGSSFLVYENDTLIGHIHRQTGPNGDKFIAVIDMNGEEKSSNKAFNSPDEALQWIEEQR